MVRDALKCFSTPFQSVCTHHANLLASYGQNELLLFPCDKPRPLYLLGKELGRGQYGRVYLSLNLRTDVQIAIKIIDYDHSKYHSYKEFLSAVKTEHQVNVLLGIAAHCPIFPKWYNSAKSAYIPMHLVRGPTIGTLFSHPRNFTFSYVSIYNETKEILVKKYHENGFIHGDAHLGNFMLQYLQVQPVDNGKAAKILKNGKTKKGFTGYIDLCHFAYRCFDIASKITDVPEEMEADFQEFKNLVNFDRRKFRLISPRDCQFY